MNTRFVGIDAGCLHTPAYVAWLSGQEFTLDTYQPAEDTPPPRTPAGLPAPAIFAVDAPRRRARDSLHRNPRGYHAITAGSGVARRG